MSLTPPGEEVEELGARLLLRKPGHPASPSRGPLDTFPPAALRKQARHCAESCSVFALEEHGPAPSTGCLLPSVSVRPAPTSSQHIPGAAHSLRSPYCKW